jgi:hypothetical protein
MYSFPQSSKPLSLGDSISLRAGYLKIILTKPTPSKTLAFIRTKNNTKMIAVAAGTYGLTENH